MLCMAKCENRRVLYVWKKILGRKFNFSRKIENFLEGGIILKRNVIKNSINNCEI